MGLIGRVWADIGGDASGLKKAAKEGEDALNKLGKQAKLTAEQYKNIMDSGVNLQGESLDDFMKRTSKSSEEAGGSFQKLTGYLKGFITVAAAVKGVQWLYKAAEASVDYADEVRNISRVTGATAEESSRLIQVSESLGITTNTLSSSMQAMVKKGYEPTIENLMELSKQYKSLEDPMKKALFLQERFTQGTSSGGAGLAPLLELGPEQIKAMGLNVRDSLILSQEDVYQARLTSFALNDLGNTYDGVLQSAGAATGGFFHRTFAKPETKLNDLNNYAALLKESGIAQEEFNKQMTEFAWTSAGWRTDESGNLYVEEALGRKGIKSENYLEEAWSAKELGNSTVFLTEAEQELINADRELENEIRGTVSEMLINNSITSDGISINENYRDKMDQLAIQESEFQAILDKGTKYGWNKRGKTMKDAAEDIEKVRDAQGKLTDQYKQQLGIGAFDLISAGMKDATPDQIISLANAVNISDDKTYGLQSALFDTIDAWDGTVDGIIKTNMALEGNIEKVEAAYTVYEKLSESTPEGWTVDSYYNIWQTTYLNTIGGAMSGKGGKPMSPGEAAKKEKYLIGMHGGSFIGLANGGAVVPPGFGNDGMPIWVSSGERLDVTPAGNSNKGKGGNTYKFYAPVTFKVEDMRTVDLMEQLR